MKYRVMWGTSNAGQYAGDQVMAFGAAKSLIRQGRQVRGLRWRQEGDDICAYASAEDMDDEDKAIARLRPQSESERE